MYDSNGYFIAGVRRAGEDGRHTCISTDTTTKTRVRLGVVDVETDGEGIGGSRVMWLRCLD